MTTKHSSRTWVSVQLDTRLTGSTTTEDIIRRIVDGRHAKNNGATNVAQHEGRQGAWPRVYGNPSATFVTRDGYLKSGRSLAGPLRIGTTGDIGPRGAPGDVNSDFGVDHISPAHGRFDPIGNSMVFQPEPRGSELIKRGR